MESESTFASEVLSLGWVAMSRLGDMVMVAMMTVVATAIGRRQ